MKTNRLFAFYLVIITACHCAMVGLGSMKDMACKTVLVIPFIDLWDDNNHNLNRFV